MKEVKTAKDQAKKERFSHSYDCTRCQKNFKLPVELDRARPIYCEDCKPIIDAERQKAKQKGEKRAAAVVPPPPPVQRPVPSLIEPVAQPPVTASLPPEAPARPRHSQPHRGRGQKQRMERPARELPPLVTGAPTDKGTVRVLRPGDTVQL